MGFPCLAFKKSKGVDDNACHAPWDSHNPGAHCSRSTGHSSAFTVLLLKGQTEFQVPQACFLHRKFGPSFTQRLTEISANNKKKYLIVSPQFRLSKGLLHFLAKHRLQLLKVPSLRSRSPVPVLLSWE